MFLLFEISYQLVRYKYQRSLAESISFKHKDFSLLVQIRCGPVRNRGIVKPNLLELRLSELVLTGTTVDLGTALKSGRGYRGLAG